MAEFSPRTLSSYATKSRSLVKTRCGLTASRCCPCSASLCRAEHPARSQRPQRQPRNELCIWERSGQTLALGHHLSTGWLRALAEAFPAQVFPGFWPGSGLPKHTSRLVPLGWGCTGANPHGSAPLGRLPALLPLPVSVCPRRWHGTGMDPAELSGWGWFVLLLGWMCSRAQLRAQLPACGC